MKSKLIASSGLSLSLTGTTIALRLKPSTAREMYSNSTFEVGKLTDLHQPLAALVAANQDSVAEILMDRRTRVRATYTHLALAVKGVASDRVVAKMPQSYSPPCTSAKVTMSRWHRWHRCSKPYSLQAASTKPCGGRPLLYIYTILLCKILYFKHVKTSCILFA